MVRNPAQSERNSGIIPNNVPGEPEPDSGMTVNADSSMKPNSFKPIPDGGRLDPE
jgi:hypothetical protein